MQFSLIIIIVTNLVVWEAVSIQLISFYFSLCVGFLFCFSFFFGFCFCSETAMGLYYKVTSTNTKTKDF